MKYPEYEEQKALIKWWRDLKKIKKVPEHYHLINTDTAAKRNVGQQVRYKLSGGQSGTLDLILAVPLAHEIDGAPKYYGALWIEMKAPDRKPKTSRGKGGLEPEQIIMVSDLTKLGYKVEVCYSAKEGQTAIENYLGMKL